MADACGVSTTWYTWLEQGRDVSASPQALARLADALHLVPAERAYLFELAGRRDPTVPEPVDELSRQVLALPGHLTIPAYVLDQAWTARAWNAGAQHLFTGWLDGDHDRNLLRYIFLSEASRRLIYDWPERGQRVAAEFRADYGRSLGNAEIASLVDELTTRSDAFRQYWQEQSVMRREGGVRRFDHPTDGHCVFTQSTLVLASNPGMKLVSLAPAPNS